MIWYKSGDCVNEIKKIADILTTKYDENDKDFVSTIILFFITVGRYDKARAVINEYGVDYSRNHVENSGFFTEDDYKELFS